MKAAKRDTPVSDLLEPFVPTKSHPYDRAAVAHLLRRCTFGHSKADLARFEAMNPESAAQALIRGNGKESRESDLARDHALQSFSW